MSDSFYELTPEFIFHSAEQVGLRSTGRCFALNSLENRVYDIEMENGAHGLAHSLDRVVAKFYRPGRWSKEALLEEHEFIAELDDAGIPVARPLELKNQNKDPSTVGLTDSGIYFAVSPKLRGRVPQELSLDHYMQVGRFIARIHNVGAQKKSKHRELLTPETYATNSLKFLLEKQFIPLELQSRYKTTVENLVQKIAPLFKDIQPFRIHGDCHMGNLLSNDQGFFFVDFDDMRMGPAAQDLWLLCPGTDEDALKKRAKLLEGYSEIRELPVENFKLFEPLRALRIINYSAWIARRWQDPSFPRIFSEFQTHNYWAREIEEIEKIYHRE